MLFLLFLFKVINGFRFIRILRFEYYLSFLSCWLPVDELILHQIALKLIWHGQSEGILVITAFSLHFLIGIHILDRIASLWNAQLLLVLVVHVLHVVGLFQIIVFLYGHSLDVAFDVFYVMVELLRFCLVYISKYIQLAWDWSHHQIHG